MGRMGPMGLRLVGCDERAVVACPACDGRGKVKHEDWQRRDGRWVAGGGWMPCETCRGAKVVRESALTECPMPNA